MKKFRFFIVAASLLLVTAGVFAKKTARFFTTPSELYYSSTGTASTMHAALALTGTDVLFNEAQSESSAQWTFTSQGGTTYGLYYYTGTANTYAAVYPGF
jgi:uncharacterized membrane protein YgdD (TMEM256/DUF423 family)